jgi:hypothetical protein
MHYTASVKKGTSSVPQDPEPVSLPVIDPAEIAQLEQDDTGIEGFLIHGGSVYRLRWAFASMPIQRE